MNECGECRRPLEEWEAGICEGCGLQEGEMKGHTDKHYIQCFHDDEFDFCYSLYSSGGTLHTVRKVCVETGKTEIKSFQGQKKARAWIWADLEKVNQRAAV